MSEFMPDERREPGSKGPEAYLSADERKALQRSLSFPEDLPPKFKSWLIDFIAVNLPQIPISQIVGFSQFTAKSAEVATLQSTTSVTYTNLATSGPELTGLSDGSYILLYGCAANNTGANASFCSPSINGSTPTDDHSAAVAGATDCNVSRSLAQTLSAGGSNSVKLQYRVTAGTGNFSKRFLIALRIGN